VRNYSAYKKDNEMKITKAIELKLKKFDWKYINEIREGVFEVLDPKKQEPEKITVLDKDHICFYDNSGSDHACCIKLKNILILNDAE
jgi:hypothetical protein